jgi:hypothetical protein
MMKQLIDGLPISDRELSNDLLYFLCAYYMGLTEKEVNESDDYRIESYMFILPLWKKKIQDALEEK